MKKTFILDTNVLLHDSSSILVFKDNLVVIPIVALEELDNFKKRQDETGRNARFLARKLDELRARGKLIDGIPLDNGGTLKVDHKNYSAEFPLNGLEKKPDNLILACAYHYHKTSDHPVILITKDINLRVKAEAFGLSAEGYEDTRVQSPEELYTGTVTVEMDSESLDRWDNSGSLDRGSLDRELFPNEFIFFRSKDKTQGEDEQVGKKTELSRVGRVDPKREKITRLRDTEGSIWGIKPRNVEQNCAFELLLDETLQIVTLVGRAGTGKTLLALACGLELVVQRGMFDRLLICRPIVPFGQDIGFLPGNIEEKLLPRMQPISDNLEFLFNERKNRGPVEDLGYFLNEGIIELEPLTYIRGRSIPNQFMIVDEAQNLTPRELKTIITRAGVNTKIVLTGDPYQIDHPYLDFSSNGLTRVVERFAGQEVYGHIVLRKGERSSLAELAADLL